MYNCVEPLKIPDKREQLEKFGGLVSITEYRKSFYGLGPDFKIILPPLVYIVPKIEEKVKMDTKKFATNEAKNFNVKNMIPVKKKLLHDSSKFNLMDTLSNNEIE